MFYFEKNAALKELNRQNLRRTRCTNILTVARQYVYAKDQISWKHGEF